MSCLLIRQLTVQQYNQLRSERGRQIIYLIYTKLVFFWKLTVSHFETTKTFQVVSISSREKSVDSCRNRSAGKYTAYLWLWGAFACQVGAKFGYLCKLIVNKWSSLKGAFSSGASERQIQKDDFNCQFWFKSCKSKVTSKIFFVRCPISIYSILGALYLHPACFGTLDPNLLSLHSGPVHPGLHLHFPVSGSHWPPWPQEQSSLHPGPYLSLQSEFKLSY